MAMNKPLMHLDEPDVQAVVNSYSLGKDMIWAVLFPLKYTRKFDLKGIEGNEGLPITADKVAFNTKAPLKSRKKVGTWSGKLGKISVSRSKDEMEINEYNDAYALAQMNDDPAAAKDLVNMVYEDYDFCDTAMNARIELDSCRIATSGKAVTNSTLDGDMATDDVIDFNIPAANFKGAKVAWGTSASADAIGDIVAAQEAVRAAGSAKPMFCYMEKSAFNELAAQKATANRIYPLANGNAQVAITSDMMGLDKINAYMDRNGYPHIYVVDTYVAVENKKGEQTPVKPWARNVVTLSAKKNLGYTWWKTVPKTEGTAALQTYGQFYKTTRYSDVNPMEETTMAEAYVQCGLVNRKSIVFINTAKTTWSNGAE